MVSKIVNRDTKAVAISWDKSTGKVEFFNTTVETYLKKGIPIPFYEKAEFEGKEVVALPSEADAATTALFIKAIECYFHSEMCKWGLELVQDTQQSGL